MAEDNEKLNNLREKCGLYTDSSKPDLDLDKIKDIRKKLKQRVQSSNEYSSDYENSHQKEITEIKKLSEDFRKKYVDNNKVDNKKIEDFIKEANDYKARVTKTTDDNNEDFKTIIEYETALKIKDEIKLLYIKKAEKEKKKKNSNDIKEKIDQNFTNLKNYCSTLLNITLLNIDDIDKINTEYETFLTNLGSETAKKYAEVLTPPEILYIINGGKTKVIFEKYGDEQSKEKIKQWKGNSLYRDVNTVSEIADYFGGIDAHIDQITAVYQENNGGMWRTLGEVIEFDNDNIVDLDIKAIDEAKKVFEGINQVISKIEDKKTIQKKDPIRFYSELFHFIKDRNLNQKFYYKFFNICYPDLFIGVYSDKWIKNFLDLFKEAGFECNIDTNDKNSDIKEENLFIINGLLALIAGEKNSTEGCVTYPECMSIYNELLYSNINKYKQVIFTGAPGTGKTFGVKKYIEHQCSGNNQRFKFVQFHSSYDYSDFVEGLRPVTLKGETKPSFVKMDGTFKKFCRQIVDSNMTYATINKNTETLNKIADALTEYLKDDTNRKNYNRIISLNPAKIDDDSEFNRISNEDVKKAIKLNAGKEYFYFIVDEINRADLSRVFGELMYGLEESYRGIENRFDTQYMNLRSYVVDKDGFADVMPFDCFETGFFIPHNLRFVGTMNDIDRSVESFDFALRRRFQWIDIKANDVMAGVLSAILQEPEPGVEPKVRLDDLIKCIVKMNTDVISGDGEGKGQSLGLGEAYHIGPAYFKGFNYTSASLSTIWDERIEPTLREYIRGKKKETIDTFIENCKNKLFSDGTIYTSENTSQSKTAKEIAFDTIKKYNQIIYTGAPGTGKTFGVKNAIKELCNSDINRYKFVQFHSSYDYSDFVEGLRPIKINDETTFVRLDGTFKKFCRQIVEANLSAAGIKEADRKDEFRRLVDRLGENSFREKFNSVILDIKSGKSLNDAIEEAILEKDKDYENLKADLKAAAIINYGPETPETNDKKYYYFIVDEINRADLSKVFGELMYGLEESYRGIENRFDTQYMNLKTYEVNPKCQPMGFDCFEYGFFIPYNLKFIGTMNDIDRSVESFDFALRRRFQWIDISANDVMEATLSEMLGGDISDLKKRIDNLNKIISSDGQLLSLNEAYHIGPAYFKNCELETNKLTPSLKKIWNERLESLLREYVRGKDTKKTEDFINKCGGKNGLNVLK